MAECSLSNTLNTVRSFRDGQQSLDLFDDKGRRANTEFCRYLIDRAGIVVVLETNILRIFHAL